MSVCEVCNRCADTPDTIWLRISPVADWQQTEVCSPRLWGAALGAAAAGRAGGAPVSIRACVGCGEPLARIVARCEREVGDGWQADPDRVRFKCGIQDLIDALPVWTTLGNRAASWLRDLTDGAE